jgi:hypothetical protein
MAEPPSLLGVVNHTVSIESPATTLLICGALGALGHAVVLHERDVGGATSDAQKLLATGAALAVPSRQVSCCVCTPEPQVAEHAPKPPSRYTHSCVLHTCELTGAPVVGHCDEGTVPPLASTHVTVCVRTPLLHGCEHEPKPPDAHKQAAVPHAC